MFDVEVRSATLQDGVAVLDLLESVGYYPDPLSFAKAFRKTIVDPHFLVRVAELDGRIVGLATLSLRYQLGLGGLLAWLDEIAIAPGGLRPPGRETAAAGHRRPGAGARGRAGGQGLGQRRNAPAPRVPASGHGARRLGGLIRRLPPKDGGPRGRQASAPSACL